MQIYRDDDVQDLPPHTPTCMYFKDHHMQTSIAIYGGGMKELVNALCFVDSRKPEALCRSRLT